MTGSIVSHSVALNTALRIDRHSKASPNRDPTFLRGRPFVSYTKAMQPESLLVQGHFSSGPDTPSATAAHCCANNEGCRASCLSLYNQESRAAELCDAGDVDQAPSSQRRDEREKVEKHR
ncbi:hypothetical protein MTO96_000258 [Rhipicephalus appendiculatus]